MGTCWQSGGPEWLFTVVVGGALVALLGNSTRLDLNKPHPPSLAKRLPLSLGLLGLLVLLMYLAGGVLWTAIGVAVVLELVGAAMFLMARTPVTAGGVPGGDLGGSGQAVRVVAHAMIAGGVVAATTASVIMIVRGGSC